MVDSKRLLDALLGASSRPGPGGGQGGNFLDQAMQVFGQLTQGAAGTTAGQVLGQATSGLREGAQRLNEATGGVGARVDEAARDMAGQAMGGQSADQYIQKAKDFMSRNPGLAEAALMGVAGLLLGTRRGRSLATSAAGMGGLALVGGLAYKAFQNYQAGRPMLDVGPAGQGAGQPAALSAPSPASFDPNTATEDDALLYARAMVAAAAADGHLDEGERSRIMGGLAQTGIDAETTRWLERELADPATIEELSDPVTTPEKAAQVYAAARVAIEPDTMQEREFLRQLAAALDLDPALIRHLDDAASGVKTGAGAM
jgi:uncharacterized membrane protein YebE (DUF533 family)